MKSSTKANHLSNASSPGTSHFNRPIITHPPGHIRPLPRASIPTRAANPESRAKAQDRHARPQPITPLQVKAQNCFFATLGTHSNLCLPHTDDSSAVHKHTHPHTHTYADVHTHVHADSSPSTPTIQLSPQKSFLASQGIRNPDLYWSLRRGRTRVEEWSGGGAGGAAGRPPRQPILCHLLPAPPATQPLFFIEHPSKNSRKTTAIDFSRASADV